MTRARDLAAFVSNADGDVKFDTDTLFIDSSTNRVGIGLTNPTGSLHISNSAPSFYMTDTTNNTEGVVSMDNAGSLILNADLNNEASSSNIRFAVDGTEAMRIDSSGNVGIGVTPEAWTSAFPSVLQIGAGMALTTSGGDNARILGNVYYDGAYKRITSGFAHQYEQTGGTHRWYYAATGAADSAISFTEIARIDSAGITLDTNSTGGKFLSLETSASGDGHILLKRNGVHKYQIASDTSHNFFIYNYNNNAFALKINTSGNLQVGGVYNDTGSDSPNVVVDGSGNIYRSTSALKYKKDVRDIESIDIDRFRPVRYKSAIAKDDDTKDCLGFISDEVHDDGLTELVTYGVNPETEETEVEGFRYDRMTVIITKVVQEQKATIEAQATQIADLITRVTALEAE